MPLARMRLGLLVLEAHKRSRELVGGDSTDGETFNGPVKVVGLRLG
jgi:hypothetical protein